MGKHVVSQFRPQTPGERMCIRSLQFSRSNCVPTGLVGAYPKTRHIYPGAFLGPLVGGAVINLQILFPYNTYIRMHPIPANNMFAVVSAGRAFRWGLQTTVAPGLGGGGGGGVYSYSADTIEGPRAPAVKLTLVNLPLTFHSFLYTSLRHQADTHNRSPSPRSPTLNSGRPGSLYSIR